LDREGQAGGALRTLVDWREEAAGASGDPHGGCCSAFT